MAIYGNLETFNGKTVVDYEFQSKQPTTPQTHAYRLRLEYDSEHTFIELLNDFFTQTDLTQLDSLIIGCWTDAYEENSQDVVNYLIEHRAKLGALKAIFFGDITGEECEASWIIQNDYDEFLKAFDQLEELYIRGSTQLVLNRFTHQQLKKLTIECGGLPAEIIGNVCASELPALKHLELWFGVEDYGFDADINFIKQNIIKIQPERLSYLGLCNAEIQNDIAQWVANEAWVAKLHTLDLSGGTMTDEGGQALLNSEFIKQLKVLDLHHHYMSDDMCEALQKLPLEVNIEEQEEADEDDDDVYRYVALSE